MRYRHGCLDKCTCCFCSVGAAWEAVPAGRLIGSSTYHSCDACLSFRLRVGQQLPLGHPMPSRTAATSTQICAACKATWPLHGARGHFSRSCASSNRAQRCVQQSAKHVAASLQVKLQVGVLKSSSHQRLVVIVVRPRHQAEANCWRQRQ